MKGSIGKVAVITGATSGIGRVLERYASGRTVRHRTRFRSLVEMSFLAALACLTGGAMCPQEPPSSTQQLPTPPVQQQATMNVAPPCIQPAPMPRMGYEPKTISNFTTYKTRVALENPCKKRQEIVIGQLKDSERLQCRRNADSDACRKCSAPGAFIGTNSGITYGLPVISRH